MESEPLSLTPKNNNSSSSQNFSNNFSFNFCGIPSLINSFKKQKNNQKPTENTTIMRRKERTQSGHSMSNSNLIISAPLGDFRHMAHIGRDGADFGKEHLFVSSMEYQLMSSYLPNNKTKSHETTENFNTNSNFQRLNSNSSITSNSDCLYIVRLLHNSNPGDQ